MSKFTQGLHNHSIFSDGDNTIEEMIESAVSKGFWVFGISDHSAILGCDDWCMPKEKYADYFAECERLKEKYKDKIEVLIGLEADILSEKCNYPLDYTIGSCHYVLKNGKRIAIDYTAEELMNGVNKHYGGDIYTLCEDYFSTVSDVVAKTDCDIIGHFDLIRKFSESVPGLIDTENPRYIIARDKAIKKLVETDKIFEVNTGAMSRGYTSEPYPERSALEMIASLGGKVTISADSHSVDTVDFGYDESLYIIKSCGFSEIWIYEKGKFISKAI